MESHTVSLCSVLSLIIKYDFLRVSLDPLCPPSSPVFVAGTVRRASAEKLSDWRGQQESQQARHMFHDTTRLRLMSRPSLKDALQSFSTPGLGSTKLGRIGVSHSFREKVATPVRPREPPPPPPPMVQLPGDASGSSYSLAKKFFSFNKTEIKRINRFLGITSLGESERVGDNNIYDIAENDEQSSDLGVSVVDNSKFYTTVDMEFSKPHVSGLKKNVSMRLRPKSNEFSPSVDPVKPPRAKRERSKSFTPRSNPLVKTTLFNRSLGHIPKSSSNSNLIGKTGQLPGSVDVNVKKIVVSHNQEKERTVSSSDLVHIFPDEERRSFKDIRKILSSPSISSSCSSSNSQIYRPKSQLSNSSSVINNSIKEEQVVILPVTQEKDSFFEHIYEEIQDKDIGDCSSQTKRPLPPLPSEKQPSPARSSPIVSSPTSPVKSIFEGASKYDILNYLEDARERGLTDCDLDLEEEEEEAETIGESGREAAELILSNRNHNNRISNISTSSTETSDSGDQLLVVGKEKLTSVEIERNDSGLGSETGRARVSTKVVARKRSDQQTEELLCLDCDTVLDTHGRER